MPKRVNKAIELLEADQPVFLYWKPHNFRLEL